MCYMGSRSPMAKCDFEGGAAHCKVQRHSAVNCAKTAEPTEMPFVLSIPMSPRNHVLDGVQIARCEGASFRGRTCPGMPDDTAVSYAKTAEPIEMHFGLWTLVGSGKHVLHGGTLHISATWRIRLNRPRSAAL